MSHAFAISKIYHPSTKVFGLWKGLGQVDLSSENILELTELKKSWCADVAVLLGLVSAPLVCALFPV